MVCPGCGGSGEISITDCPLNFINNDIWQIIQFAELFEKGAMPIDGGVLDQAESFIESATFVLSEKAYWKAKLGIIE